MLGAFVWDWVDESRVVDLDELGYEYGVTDKTGVKGNAVGEESKNWIDNAGEESMKRRKSIQRLYRYGTECPCQIQRCIIRNRQILYI